MSAIANAILPVVALLGALSWAYPATADDTLARVKARGTLRCGISEGIVGFSAKDKEGRWTGLEADFCRALAAATLGDAGKVTFVPLKASARFPALRSGVIDLLARHTAWTLSREAVLKVQFAGILYYDAQGFLLPSGSGVKTIAQLNGATICVEKGMIHERILADHFTAHRMTVTPLPMDASAGVTDTLFAGHCQAYTSDVSQLAAARLEAPAGRTFDILPEVISKLPIGPVVRNGDEGWLSLVRWVLFALLAAEEHGFTRDNVRTRLKSTHDPALLRAAGTDPEFSNALGVDPEWAIRAVESVGNYGELFERHLGHHSPLKLERGLNRLWTQGGLMYAPPFR